MRLATEQDLEELTQMQIDFETHFQNLMNKTYSINKEERKKELHAVYFSKNAFIRTLIAEVDGKIAGRVSFYKGFQSTVPPIYVFHLSGVYVKESYRGLRIAEQLFEHLRGIAKKEGMRRLVWSVLGSNAPAIKVYNRLGGRYYETVEDKHFMFLEA